MQKLLILILFLITPHISYAKDMSLSCNMTSYGNTTNVNVAKSWVNPKSDFEISGNNSTYYYSNKSLSGNAIDKGDRLKMYFSRMVSMKSGNGSKQVKADMTVDYFYKNKKIAVDWSFVGYNNLGVVWGTCDEN